MRAALKSRCAVCRIIAGMVRRLGCALWVAGLPLCALAEEGAGELLERVRARMRENLSRAPDYVCQETVERWARDSQRSEFKALDMLRLEVGFAGGKEIFSWRGASRFEEKELADLIGSGVVGTGAFAVHAANVFLSGAAEFTYRGEEEWKGKRSFRFDYAVPREHSRYRVRVPPYQAVVGFHGSFWVDAETLDLLRLEVHADEIPDELRLARTSDVMEYQRVTIGRSDYLLPASSEFTMLGTLGNEYRNRRRLTDCRQYAAEASVRFDPGLEMAPVARASTLPPRLVMELVLDSSVDLETVALGDEVRAVLARPVIHQGQLLAPQGSTVLGRLVRLEKNSMPYPHYVVGLQFDILESPAGRLEFAATLEDVAPAAGLIRQAKTLDPTFDRRRRAPRLDILVRERQEGRGVLHWDARQPRIRRGLRMRWRTEPALSSAHRGPQ
jgi:hypothetical protein